MTINDAFTREMLFTPADAAEDECQRLRERVAEALLFLAGCEVSVSKPCGSCRICDARLALEGGK